MKITEAEYLELIDVNLASTGHPDSVKLLLTSTSSASIEITIPAGIIF